jgi:hypothetical protein
LAAFGCFTRAAINIYQVSEYERATTAFSVSQIVDYSSFSLLAHGLLFAMSRKLYFATGRKYVQENPMVSAGWFAA